MSRRKSIGVILGALGLALIGCDRALLEPGGVVRDGDMGSIHQVGPVVELTKIRRR